MPKTIFALQHDTVDEICWRVYGRSSGVVEKVLEEKVPETDDELSMDATRQFTPEEMEELQRRVEAGNKHLEETQKIAIVDDNEADSEINLNETQTFKLNIEE